MTETPHTLSTPTTAPPPAPPVTSPFSANDSKPHRAGLQVQKNLLAGVFAIVPIAVTWWVFESVVQFLAETGSPLVTALARLIAAASPPLAPALAAQLSQGLLHPAATGMLAALIIVLALYLLGYVTTHVLGQRLIHFAEGVIDRIPLVKTVYGLMKRMVTALQQSPAGQQRVVLIDFPHKEARAIGFVMRVLHDARTGQELAAVYVPTAPNPSSGYIELVPPESLTPVDWTMDEAMTFILSGGAVAKDKIGPPAAGQKG